MKYLFPTIKSEITPFDASNGVPVEGITHNIPGVSPVNVEFLPIAQKDLEETRKAWLKYLSENPETRIPLSQWIRENRPLK